MTASGEATFTGELFAGRRLELRDADVTHVPGFFDVAESDALLHDLGETIVWRHDSITMYGKTSPIPRLNAWYGDAGKTYRYSNISMQPRPWTPALTTIRERIERECDQRFNSVLLNLYRDGRDGVAWHADDEPELGPEPVIASVSFGATRRFQLRHRNERTLQHELALAHGGLVVMRGPTQAHWLHQVPKTSKPVAPRINLTFRSII